MSPNAENAHSENGSNKCVSAQSTLSLKSFPSEKNFDFHRECETGETKQSLDFDTAIQLTGYGFFHYRLVAVCALCLINNGLQNGLASYIFPAAQCDLGITSAEIGYLNVAFLVGGVCSSFLWGAIADLVGRRQVLIYTLFLSAIATLAGAFQQSLLGLCACRFLNGFLTGAAGSITFNYVSEFHAPAQRAKSVCYAGVFYTSAWLLLPVLAVLILPIPPAALAGIPAWRLFLAAVALPECLAAVCLIFLPESPKYAAEKDRPRALAILRRMYAANRRCKPEDFPVRELIAPNGFTVEKMQETDGDDVVCVGKVKRLIGCMLVQIKKIFQQPLVFITALISFIMFCNMFGYFGLGLWLPELFTRFEQFEEHFPNKSASVQYLASMNFAKNTTCVPEFNGKLFRSTLSIGASSLVGNLVSGWLSGKLSLKVIPLVTMFVGGVSSGCIYWLSSSWQNLVVACIFQTVMATANITLGGVVVELFPTKVAGIALCLTLFVGRVSGMLSNLMFGLLMDKQASIPIFTVSVMLLLGAVCCLFIPNGDWMTKKKHPLSEVITKQPLAVAIITIEK